MPSTQVISISIPRELGDRITELRNRGGRDFNVSSIASAALRQALDGADDAPSEAITVALMMWIAWSQGVTYADAAADILKARDALRAALIEAPNA